MATDGRARRSKGARTPTLVRLPDAHLARYKAAAAELGLPFCDYVELLLSRDNDVPISDYILRALHGSDGQLNLGIAG